MSPSRQTAHRKIGVVTSSRADYGHLYWLLRELAGDAAIDPRLYVTGAHLLERFGRTVEVIERDGLPIAARVPCMEEGDDRAVGMARAIGRATAGFADLLERDRPDLLVVIADRFEMLGPACAAMTLRIPLAHIEGGERSEGAIDQAVRDGLTMMSHVHLVSNEGARRRLLRMGEESWRIHVTGAGSLDHLRRSAPLSRAELERRLGISLGARPIVAAVHPVTLDADPTADGRAVLEALREVEGPIVFTFPNADAEGRRLIDAARGLCESRADARLFENLEPAVYWSLLRHAACLVGNSSSGVMEAASVGIGAVDVGTRQQGREAGRNVVRVPAERRAIVDAIGEARSKAFRPSLAGLVNPYGDGDAGRRIHRVLTTIALDDRLLRKRVEAEPPMNTDERR